VRVLNRGGPANPDVLVLARGGAEPVIVKDYARRSRLARLLGPAFVRHELAMLERLEGIPGVPRPVGRLGRLALAMELVDGVPLRRHALPEGLDAAFFDALEGIVAAISARGVVHLDLRSPTNVLCTRSGGPAIVDLASAFRLPLPRSLAQRFHARALRKLRRRFEREGSRPPPPPAPIATRDFSVGHVRFRLADVGSIDDPVPALLLHDVGHACVAFAEVVARAEAAGRRAIAPDLPPFGASSRVRRGLSPQAQAARVMRLLDALRVARVDAVGHGFGGFVARALYLRAPERVRRLVTLDTPTKALAGAWLGRVEAACAGDGEALLRRLLAELPEVLRGPALEQLRGFLLVTSRPALVGSLRSLATGPGTPALREAAPGIEVGVRGDAWLGATSADRIWKEISGTSG
jgi:pimeloyl-ACP methyl ester carboxylesterase